MRKILVTGGTVFVSRYIAEYYVAKGYEVYVLNRNTRPQSKGVRLIEADRHRLGDALRGQTFDVVIDTAYNAGDVEALLHGLDGYDQYILISSSAVYPDTGKQPFSEGEPVGENRFWGKYGTDKIDAEKYLQKRDENAYILRPPYLYGPMNNVYREAFVFDCALAGRPFYLPGDGEMQLQFFHVEDLCRFMDALLEKKPSQRIWNVGNRECISVRRWAALCYEACGKTPAFVSVPQEIEQRQYFSFYAYEYALDVAAQHALLPQEKPLAQGLGEALAWYREHPELVNKKPFLEFIDSQLAGKQ